MIDRHLPVFSLHWLIRLANTETLTSRRDLLRVLVLVAGGYAFQIVLNFTTT
jgi:hypothetical protein